MLKLLTGTVVSLFLAGTAIAQAPPQQGGYAPYPQGGYGAPPPAAPQGAYGPAGYGAPPPAVGATDHDAMVGALGLHYFGAQQITALGYDATTGSILPQTLVTAPTFGVRYWMNPKTGLDLGVGFGFNGASISGNGASQDLPSAWGLGVTAGLPFVIGDFSHVSFFIEPSALLYYASLSNPSLMGGPTTTTSTTNFALVGDLVGELQFGFWGLPQLSVEARVGAGLGYASTDSSVNGQTGTLSGYVWAPTNEPFSLHQLVNAGLGVTYYTR